MTVSSTNAAVSYPGTGAQTGFTMTFKFIANSHVEAILRDAAGTETTWAESTQYTLTGAGSDTGGTLTVKTTPTDYTPAAGETLVIRRVAPETQGSALPAGCVFPSATVEQGLDLLTMQVQQHSEELGRVLTVPKTDTATSLELPNETDRASKFLSFDGSGNPIAAAGTSADLTPVSTFINTLLDDADSGAALATLVAAGTAIVNSFTKTQSWAKGADIASAAPLVLGTEGNYFDVTGTTDFAAITVAAGTLFMLQFDENLTMTDGASLDLGGADIKTAIGDRGLFFATAANTVTLLSYLRASASSRGLPRGYGFGCVLSRDAGDTTNDVNVTAGEWRDSTNAHDIVLTGEITKKIDAPWAVGDDAGGLDGSESVAGTPDNDTWYFVHLIRRNDTGVVDVLFSESATAPTLPTGYDVFRRIGAVRRGTAATLAFTQHGDEFLWSATVNDVDLATLGTSTVSYALTVPLGIIVTAIFNAYAAKAGLSVTLRALDTADETVDETGAAGTSPNLAGNNTEPGATTAEAAGLFRIRTNISGEIGARSAAASTTILISTLGWADDRGRSA